MSEELKEKLRKELRVFQDYTASWGYPMNSEVHRTGLDKAEAKLLELFESYAKEREIEGQKLYTQSEVDRLIREAVEKELKKAIEYARNLPDVGIRYPEDREKCREFARASSVMMNYVSTRLESLSKQKEGSK